MAEALISSEIETAVRELVTVQADGDSTIIDTPMMYPSGATVSVRVTPGDTGRYFISDFGTGLLEAEMMGADRIYKRCAPIVSDESGVGFDKNAFFVVDADIGQLTGAIAAVSNCSQRAVNVASMKLAERRVKDDDEILYTRLQSLFDHKHVARDVELSGASSTKWHVASMVTVDKRRYAFDAVSKHPNSVVFAATKFRDLAQLGNNAPGRISMVRSKKDLKTYLGVLEQSSNVIEFRAPDNQLREAVRLAA